MGGQDEEYIEVERENGVGGRDKEYNEAGNGENEIVIVDELDQREKEIQEQRAGSHKSQQLQAEKIKKSYKPAVYKYIIRNSY